MEAKDNLTKAQMGEANRLYEDTKQEYESIEEQVDTMDASIETYNRKLTETSNVKTTVGESDCSFEGADSQCQNE